MELSTRRQAIQMEELVARIGNKTDNTENFNSKQVQCIYSIGECYVSELKACRKQPTRTKGSHLHLQGRTGRIKNTVSAEKQSVGTYCDAQCDL